MSEISQPNHRSGMLAGGNWIIDQVKIIDVYPKHEQLANIHSQSQGTGGSSLQCTFGPGQNGCSFPIRRSRSGRTGWIRGIYSGRLPEE